MSQKNINNGLIKEDYSDIKTYVIYFDSNSSASTPGATYAAAINTDGSLSINDSAKSTNNGAVSLGEIPEGAVCRTYPEKAVGNWMYVEYKGVQGYAYNHYLQSVSPYRFRWEKSRTSAYELQSPSSSGSAMADNGHVEKGNIYKILSGKRVKLVKHYSKTSAVAIPNYVKIQGAKYKVVSIGARAFKNDKSFRKLTIGKYVKSIGREAFSGCTNLKKITLKTKSLTKKNVGARYLCNYIELKLKIITAWNVQLSWLK